jgi:hypothetical protein
MKSVQTELVQPISVHEIRLNQWLFQVSDELIHFAVQIELEQPVMPFILSMQQLTRG